jgi:hypothetical protein
MTVIVQLISTVAFLALIVAVALVVGLVLDQPWVWIPAGAERQTSRTARLEDRVVRPGIQRRRGARGVGRRLRRVSRASAASCSWPPGSMPSTCAPFGRTTMTTSPDLPHPPSPSGRRPAPRGSRIVSYVPASSAVAAPAASGALIVAVALVVGLVLDQPWVWIPAGVVAVITLCTLAILPRKATVEMSWTMT